MATKKKVASKAVEVKSAETQNIVEKVATRKVSDIVQEFADLGIKVQRELAEISAKIGDGRRQFEDVTTAIAAREARLDDLFQVEAELLSLDDVRGQRLAAEAENEAYLASLEVERAREDDEYNYNLTRKRRDDLDRYNDQVAIAKRGEEARKADLAAQWERRGDELDGREAEIEALKAQVAGYPELVGKEVAKSEAILKNVLTKQFTHETELLKKDKATAEQIAAQQIASLRAELVNAKAHAEALARSLEDARASVKEIATKAVESTAGQQALTALQGAMANQAQSGKSGR